VKFACIYIHPKTGQALYVFESGEIWRFHYSRTWKNAVWRKFNPSVNYKNGYLSIYGQYVHRIVGKCFIPNSENKPCINHKDGNKANNAVSNLEWVTYSENHLHAFAKGFRTVSEKALKKFAVARKRRRKFNWSQYLFIWRMYLEGVPKRHIAD
jgi:hypothetical protein